MVARPGVDGPPAADWATADGQGAVAAWLRDAPVGAAVLDETLRFVMVNRELARINQLPVEEHLGRPLEEALPSVSSGTVEIIRGILAGGEAVLGIEVDDPETRPGLRQVAVLASWFPLHGHDGTVTHVAVCLLDITAQRLPKRRLGLLAQLSELFAAPLDLPSRVQLFADLLVPAMGDLSVVLLPGAGGLQLAAYGTSTPELAAHVQRSLLLMPDATSVSDSIQEVVATGRTAVTLAYDPARDAGSDEHLAALRDLGLQRTITVPMRLAGETRGVLALGRVGPTALPYDEDERVFIEEIAARAAAAVDNARLYEELAASEQRLRSTAAVLQSALLPPALPRIAGLDLAALFVAAGDGNRVGGDTYDVFPVGGGWVLAVADVCGQGPRAAAATSLFRHTLLSEALHDPTPGPLLERVNDVLVQGLPESVPFLTAAVAYLNARDDEGSFDLQLAVAGHPPPLLLRDGAALLLDVQGPLLGAFAEVSIEHISLELSTGDLLLLYTDGLTEAHVRGGPQFDEQLLYVAALRDDPTSQALLRRLEHRLREHLGGDPSDDIAALAIRTL